MTTDVDFDVDVSITSIHPVDGDGNVDESVDFEGDDSVVDFDWDDHTVTVDNPPWQRAFDTDTFHRFEAVVARPIPQDYVKGGELRTFKKPPEELKKASWSLDNAPMTVGGHPSTRIVQLVEDVRGFWKNPRYVEHDAEPDEQRLRGYIPDTDTDALETVLENGSVSVASHNVKDYDVDEDGIDAYQTNLVYDHVAAGVEDGRCSVEDGCGITTDTSDTHAAHGTSETIEGYGSENDTTALRSGSGPLSDDLSWEQGEHVKWVDNDDELCHGNVRWHNGADDVVFVFDGDTHSIAEVDGCNLDEWVGPGADSCPGSECNCGHHTSDTMTETDNDSTDDGTDFDFDVSDMALDAVAERHDGVAEVVEERDEYEQRIDALQGELDEVNEDLEEARDELAEYEQDERDEIVDEIVDLTDHFDEDEMRDPEDGPSMDALRDRRDFAREITSSETTVGSASSPETDTDTEPESTQSEYKANQIVDLSDTA